MRLVLAATSLLAFAAASPCKPKPKSTADSASVTSTSVESTTASPTSSTASVSSETSLSGTPTAISTVSSTAFSSASSDSSSSSSSSSSAVESGSISTSVSSLTTTSSASEVTTTTTSVASATTASTSSSSSTEVSSTASSTSSSSTDVLTTTTASSDVSSTVSSSSSSSTDVFTTTTGPGPTPTTTSSTSATSVPPTTTTSTASSTTSVNNPATASVTNPLGRTFYDPDLQHGTSGRTNPEGGYICYAGPNINFPPQNTWASFDAMWALLSQRALAAIGDTPAQVSDIHDAILNVSLVAGVDARVILAVVVTESTGNVNVGCTFNGVENCGLMQSYEGVSYNPNDSRNSIHQMIQDGTQGTITGPGLVQLLDDQRSQGDLWQALRLYNSGSIDYTNLSDGRGAVDAYVSFVANYLTGWVGFGQDVNDCDYSQPIDTPLPN